MRGSDPSPLSCMEQGSCSSPDLLWADDMNDKQNFQESVTGIWRCLLQQLSYTD